VPGKMKLFLPFCRTFIKSDLVSLSGDLISILFIVFKARCDPGLSAFPQYVLYPPCGFNLLLYLNSSKELHRAAELKEVKGEIPVEINGSRLW
jgi:hypothetical protein